MNEDREQEIKEGFNKSIELLSKIKGEVKAYMLLALTDDPSSDGDKNSVHGVNASGGKMKHLVTLFNNIPKQIKAAAAAKSLIDVMKTIEGEVEKNDSNRADESRSA